MTPPGTFERVYAGIRQRLGRGLYRPGERLEPALLSDELNASVTPVRDALHRLTGERLVEAPRHEGFRNPMLTETTLRHLYAWHLDLLLLAAMRHGSPPGDPIDSGNGDADAPAYQRQAALFLALARGAGNPEHALAVESVSARLLPVQRLEERFLDETEGETEDILRFLQSHDRKGLRSSLLRYHRRRQRIVPQLLDALLEP